MAWWSALGGWRRALGCSRDRAIVALPPLLPARGRTEAAGVAGSAAPPGNAPRTCGASQGPRPTEAPLSLRDMAEEANSARRRRRGLTTGRGRVSARAFGSPPPPSAFIPLRRENDKSSHPF